MSSYLDYAGLSKYNDKIQAKLAKKVDAVAGKGLSTEDYTTADKEKLAGLTNYILPAAATETLGGVIVNTTANPVPEKTALKADATGKAFVDWTEAPQASTSVAGLIKLGEGFTTDPETGVTTIDGTVGGSGTVEWSAIQNKPELALKSDIAGVYSYKGSVATYDDLPTTDLSDGDVYNVESNGGKNYAWTGSAWDDLGGSFSITAITDTEIDDLFNEET